MTTCPNAELVKRYTAGDCTTDERRELEAHLAKCETCRRKVESARTNEANQSELVTKSMSEGSPFPYTSQEVDASSEPMIGGYKILGKLPAGGQAVVYKAFQEATKRIVAVKVLLQRLHTSERAQYRFEREVALAASLRHPNIVTIYDSGIAQGQYYYAMEYIEGEPLDKYVSMEKLSIHQIMELFNKMCSAVAYAHQHGVMHRDLKPSNILVDCDGEPHILDFGLAKLIDDSQQSALEAKTVSIAGKIIGTLAFMSPEQASGQPSAVDIRTDIYSIGMILYNVLTDDFPYDVTGSMLETLRNIQEIEPVRPSKIVSPLNSDVEAIVLKALAKEPKYRYQSAADMQRDVEYWLKGLPISARSDSSIYLLRKFIVRHRTVSIVAGLLMVIIVSTTFISLYSYSQARAALKQSQLKQQWYMKEAGRISTFSNQVAFASFLSEWHSDEPFTNLRGLFFDSGKKSREQLAAFFLLDPRALAEKQAQFREKLLADGDQSSFFAFVMGEYHLKNKNEAAAIEAYKQCLQAGQKASELDDWFQNRARRKLSKLLNEDIPVRSCPDINAQ